MTKKRDNITPFQFFSITLFSMAFGLTIYPSSIGHDITDEWFIAQLISVILVIPILLMQIRIFKYTETDCFTNSIYTLVGDVPSRIIGLLLFLYFLLHAIRLVSLESNDIQLFLFDKTPISAVATVILISAFIISLSGASALSKLTEILSIPILLTIFIILSLFLSASDFGEIKTLFQPQISGIFSQVIKSVSCFFCIETTLFFICRTENKKYRKLALLGGFSICAAVLLILTLCIVGIFTLKAGANLIYPVTELARTVQLKYMRVIERFDTVALIIKIISSCVFTSIVCFCSAESLSMVFRPARFRYSISVYGILLFIFLFDISEKINELISFVLIYAEISVLFVFIPILFVFSVIKKRGRKNAL